MTTKTLKFTLEVELEVDGKEPTQSVMVDKIIDAMSEHFPSVMFDDDELDCVVFTNSFCYEVVK